MSSITSGISIYPSGFDLNVSGSTMVYVADEIRDPFTGNIVTSGTDIMGIQMNTAYTAIDNIEQTLGLNPQGSFPTVADRILSFETISGSNAYVRKDGDSMSGNLSMISGAVISLVDVVSSSGVNWSGTGSFSLNNNGAITYSGQSIQFTSAGVSLNNAGQQFIVRTGSGLSNALIVSSGGSVFFSDILPSGTINIGTETNPINTLYVTNFSGAGAASIGSGLYLPLAGGVLSGTLTMSGASIVPDTSGSGLIGTNLLPFAQMWANAGKFGALQDITGGGGINLVNDLYVSANIWPAISGGNSLGTPSHAFSGAYVQHAHVDDITISGTLLDLNTLVLSSGSTMTGNLIMASGATIVNAISGVNDLGTQANPFDNIWANSLNGKSSVKFKFNELLNPTVSGSYTFASSPSGATVVDVTTIAGVTGVSRFLVPTTHYTISGNTLTLAGAFTASGSLYSPFYVY